MFRSPFFERNGYLLSHCNILLSSGTYHAFVVLYDGQGEDYIEGLLSKLRKGFYKDYNSRKRLWNFRRNNFRASR